MSNELTSKLKTVREILQARKLAAIRLRGVDWFAWATCGGSNAVLLTAETGVAEVLVTSDGAWVLTDEIERDRLQKEEVPAALPIHACPWTQRQKLDAFVRKCAGDGPVASDRPRGDEKPLPAELQAARWSLFPAELDRYRALGQDAASVMTEVLVACKPDWTEYALAGASAEALWQKGIHPALTLVGGEARLPVFRHPTPSLAPLGNCAMLVFCARRHGLYANLTRFVYFRSATKEERQTFLALAHVEAAALAASRPGVRLSKVLSVMTDAYATVGHPGAERFHHQGGSCGYLSRDVVAVPDTEAVLQETNAVAWNPSLPGLKIEDTVVVSQHGEEILTVDARWPTFQVEGRARPDVLIRT